MTSNSAIEYLIETIRAEEGLWLVPIGPLTNVAIAFRQAPDLPQKLAGLSFMGGSAGSGNHSAVAEFNVLVDPEAAAVVINSGATIHMAGLDLTNQFVVDDALAGDIAATGGPGAAVLSDLMYSYLDQGEKRNGMRLGGLHDPCAVLAVTHPEVVTATPRHVDVELAGTLTRGMTVVDLRRAGAAEPNVMHGHTLDHPVARKLTIDAIAARDQS